MTCPVCITSTLRFADDGDRPKRLICDRCGGHWVRDRQYWSWRRAHGEDLPPKEPEPGTAPVVEDSPGAKLCPECGRILSRRRAGYGLDFILERCPDCGGLWFDSNEWEALESRNLHDDVHMIFSEVWQRARGRDESRRDHEELLAEILGVADYATIRQFRCWLRGHPHCSTMMGYLLEGPTPEP